jgi:DNA-binding NarL/FixJ family response regulator
MTVTAPARPACRVLIVDDHILYAEALELALSGRGYDARCLVPRRATRPAHLVSAIVAGNARVVLLDLDLGGGLDGLSLIEPLTSRGTRVVVVTATADPHVVGQCLQRGAHHVLQKARDLEDVFTTVREVQHGRPLLDLEGRRSLMLASAGQGRTAREPELLTRLSRREAAVLKMLMNGSTVNEIARRDIVSVATVRTQVKAILTKLEVGSQLAAVAIAYRARWSPAA